MNLKRQVKFKPILILLACLLVLGITVRLVHGYQVKRNAAALLLQADQAEEEGDATQAADYLGQYLGMEPGDTDALARYALLLNKLATTPQQRIRPYFLLEQVLRRDPERNDLRREATRLAVELRLWSDARAHAKYLMKDAPNDAALIRVLGQCEAGKGDYNAAVEHYARALELDPKQVEWWVEYAILLRDRLRTPEQANEVISQMVEANQRSPAARRAAARHFLEAGDLDRAVAEVQFALKELKAQDAEILLLAAEVASARKQTDQARKHLEEGIKLHPREPRLRMALARLEAQAGRKAQALALLEPILQKLPRKVDELWTLGHLLVDLDKRWTEEVIKRLETARASWAVNFLQARIHLRKGAWGQARLVLEKVRPQLPTPEMTRYANRLLAECYARLGNPDEQLIASCNALQGDPTSVPARRQLAQALVALGRTDEAIREYQKLLPRDPEVRLDLARLLVGRNFRLPPDQRNWLRVEEVLKGIAKDATAAPEARLLQAQILVARGERDKARELVEAERKRDPKQVGPWLFLIGLAERQDGQASVLGLLDQAEREADRRVEWELARARHWVRSGKPEAREQISRLEARIKEFTGTEQDQLLLGLAEAHALAGDVVAATRLWRESARRQPNNLEVRFLLFELALQQEKTREAHDLLKQIKQLEGQGGPVATWCEAALLFHEARPDDPEALAEVRRLLTRVGFARPSWSRVPLLEARLYDREGHRDRALERYLLAMERGERRVSVLRRAMQLLHAEGRYAEASALVARLPERALSSPGLGLLAAEVSLRSLGGAEGEDPDQARKRALELARKAVPADSRDHRDLLWLGQIYALAEQPTEAEKAFRQALAQAKTAPETWATLILFLARTNPKRAQAELQAAKAALSADDLQLILGPVHEALGQLSQAEAQYRAALVKGSPDSRILRDMASFYARLGQREKAEPYLRQIIDGKVKATRDQVTWARRALAVLLAGGGNYQQFREAQSLLEQNTKGGAESLEDRRVRALVLATRPEHRREAIRLFEGLSSGSASPRPEIRYLLSQLYEADDKWPRAVAQMRALLAEHGKNPVYITHYLRALLRHDQANEAGEWPDRLATLAPAAFETAELRARVLHATGKTDAAVEVLKVYARQKDARLDQVAHLLDRFDRPAEARRMYEAHIAASKDPASVLLLAEFLVRRDQVADALAICEKAWSKCLPERVALTCLGVIRSDKASAKQREQVQRWVTDAARKRPKSVVMRLLLAEMHDVTGSHDEAMTLYNRVLVQEPRNAVALNNLAFLLALREGMHAEALKLAQGAIDELGPHAELLDTRAVIYTVAGKPADAIKDLQQAVAQSPSAAKFFHLAQAHLQAEDRIAARNAYRRAVTLGLKEADLHPLERSKLKELRSELE